MIHGALPLLLLLNGNLHWTLVGFFVLEAEQAQE